MSRPLIYASTAAVSSHFRTLPELLESLTCLGINGIELGWSPPLAGLALPAGLGRFSARFLVHNYFPAPVQPFVLNLASQNAATLQRSRDFCTAALRLSTALGAPFYSVHCGFLAELDRVSLGGTLTFAEICDYERGYTTFAESLSLLLAEAKTAGLGLLVEPNVVAPPNLVEGRNALLMMAEPRELVRLLGDFNSSPLGVLLDLGHLKVTATTLGFRPAEFIEAVAPAIGGFHLHDNDGTSDQHQPVRPGSWTLDVLRQPRFHELPVVVEAKFPGAKALAEHCIWLTTQLNS